MKDASSVRLYADVLEILLREVWSELARESHMRALIKTCLNSVAGSKEALQVL